MTLRKAVPLAFAWALLTLGAPNAVRAGTVIDFDDLNLPDFGDIPGDYKSRAPGTPNIVVSYRTFEETDDSTIANHLDFWNDNYGDLNKVAFAVQNGRGAEISLTPDAGWFVRLNGFDLAGWSQTDRIAQFVRIVDANNNLLVDLGTDITIKGAGPSHSSFSPKFTYHDTIKIQWANDWNIGIDNISIAQAIPEPSSVILCVIGAGGLALGSRLRRTARRSAA